MDVQVDLVGHEIDDVVDPFRWQRRALAVVYGQLVQAIELCRKHSPQNMAVAPRLLPLGCFPLKHGIVRFGEDGLVRTPSSFRCMNYAKEQPTQIRVLLLVMARFYK